MSVAVRVAGAAEDWPAVRALLVEAFAFMEGRIDPPSSLHRMTAADLATAAGEGAAVLAHDGGALVGCAFASVKGDALYLGKVAVAASARRRGVTRAMFAAAEAEARRRGLGALELQTRIELVENHETFARLGFVRTAETAHPGFDRPTSVTMRKELF